MKNKMRGIGRLEVISFTTGFILLAYELIAARVMAPSIGSSTYVWTSVIGIIIAALSLGYVAGGKLADARAKPIDVVWLCLLAAWLIVLSRWLYPGVLDWVASTDIDTRMQAVMAATILFAPASFVLGAISPYLVKLKLTSLAESGQSVASLSATNSVGGIAGTFVTGFILFGYVGLDESLTILVVAMIATSWLLVVKQYVGVRLGISAVLILFGSIAGVSSQSISIDTPSAHYEVSQGLYNNQLATFLVTGPYGIQSAVYENNPEELVFWYSQAMARIADEIQPSSIVVLGGGAFTFPEYLASEFPDATIDVVEIDPELEQISKDYFNYSAPANIRAIGQDARTFVEQSEDTYDFVVVDVYGDTEIPPSLMTKEFGDAIARITTDDGVVAVNLITALQGACRPIFESADALYRQHFSQAIYSVDSRLTAGGRANYVTAYSNQPLSVDDFRTLEPLDGTLYTDNFIPAERMFHNCAANG